MTLCRPKSAGQKRRGAGADPSGGACLCSTWVLKAAPKWPNSERRQPEEMILAVKKPVRQDLSCTVILGIGKRADRRLCCGDGKVISSMQPHYLGALTLMIEEKTKLKAQIESGEFQLLNPLEVIDELIMMIEPMELENCVFRSNHASNYLYLKGTLNKDKEKLLRILKEAKNNSAMLAAEENRLL